MRKFIPMVLQSLNTFANKKNRWAYANWKKKVRVIGLYLPEVTRIRSKSSVVIARHYGKGRRKYDHDNMVGGCKPIIDLLVRQGYLYNDTPEYVEVEYIQVKSDDGEDQIEIQVDREY